jgi:quinohemoprotein ethanol dehydrogenase
MDVGWKFGAPRRLLTFALDGNAALPPAEPPNQSVRALDDPALKLNETEVDAGGGIYRACAPCHGLNAVSGGAPAPDLRASAIALDPQSLYAVVHDGTLIQQGMPRFENLTREQIEQIYAYIRARARGAERHEN